jgi:hypothetical protein
VLIVPVRGDTVAFDSWFRAAAAGVANIMSALSTPTRVHAPRRLHATCDPPPVVLVLGTLRQTHQVRRSQYAA